MGAGVLKDEWRGVGWVGWEQQAGLCRRAEEESFTLIA